MKTLIYFCLFAPVLFLFAHGQLYGQDIGYFSFYKKIKTPNRYQYQNDTLEVGNNDWLYTLPGGFDTFNIIVIIYQFNKSGILEYERFDEYIPDPDIQVGFSHTTYFKPGKYIIKLFYPVGILLAKSNYFYVQ